ncbi:trypsin-like peptidase domain-containing protein [Streptomyces sp. HNM0663]|uniref:Trypsin-like peptidase domain-containing protein n=1 Tax=Streptomyces chengmaiensis TaxID=3040919 RepID=A0ABT6HQX2_9ACTN|nr:trypsin-like peptidase domain-containing protein [Streptomyces chengmaiensis]MDH2390745.1 trypsin-like peptidase domain-containing protein [Streptomyces chengmaiensis]
MGWFHAADRSTPPDPRFCVVSVLSRSDGRAAGAGVLLTTDALLTCAHVVNDALGREQFDPRRPGAETIAVSVNEPSGARRYRARTVCWIPPRRLDGSPEVRLGADAEWLGDLAVLRLEGASGESTPPQWHPMAEGQTLRAWHGSSLRRSYARVQVTSCDGTFGYVDGEPTGMPIGRAYSGGPLWSGTYDAVVGVVASHLMPPADPATGRPLPYSTQDVARRSWSIPWQRVERELRAAGAGALFDAAEGDPDDPALPVLTDLIESLFPSPMLRADIGRTVADRCGLSCTDDGTAPSAEEFASLLVTEARALAALSEALRRQDPDATAQLLSAGRLSQVPRLLSPREHRKLRTLLDAVPRAVPARLPEAVRAALPLVAALPADAATEVLLDRLECLPGDSRAGGGPRVPGLLRVIEYLAVLCDSAQRARLRLWCDGVAERLGIPRAALAERRSDADEWARARSGRHAPPRALVHVMRASPERFRMRVWCDEGAGPRQVSAAGDTTYSGREAARELLRLLESLCRSAPDDRRPLIEALVDRSGLNLPIDEWESFGPDDLVPGVLGAEYPIVVHCPELLRRNERFLPDWRRRWSQLDTGASLRFTDASASAREIYGALIDRMDTVRVTVDVPPRVRDEIVQVCLVMGVPVVVWDRESGPPSDAVERMTSVAPRQLPEEVRSYRARTVHRPAEYPGRPVLAWADADRSVPQLHLSEPQESV